MLFSCKKIDGKHQSQQHICRTFQEIGSGAECSAEKVGELAYDAAGGTIFVCNGDCQTDVDALEKFLQEKYGRGIDLVVYTGTVVGSHSGPGTLAIFFVGKER